MCREYSKSKCETNEIGKMNVTANRAMDLMYEHILYDAVTLLQTIPKLTGVEDLSFGGQASASVCKTI